MGIRWKHVLVLACQLAAAGCQLAADEGVCPNFPYATTIRHTAAGTRACSHRRSQGGLSFRSQGGPSNVFSCPADNNLYWYLHNFVTSLKTP